MTAHPAAGSLRTLAIAFFLASLLFAPYATRHPGLEESGFSILIFGWASLVGPQPLTAWLANPLVMFCFFRMKAWPRLCIVLSALALVAAHDFAKVDTLGFDSGMDIYYGKVVGLKAGSYLWLASLVLTLAASLAFFRDPVQPDNPLYSDDAVQPVYRPSNSRNVVLIAFALLLLGYGALKLTQRLADDALIRRVAAEALKVRLPSGSTQIYQEVSSNRDCDRAHITVVYSVDLGKEQICQSVHSSLDPKWRSDPCAEQWGTPPGPGPQFAYQHLEASVSSENLQLTHRAYDVEAHAQFLPINQYIETDVIRAVHQAGKSYFYVNVEYQNPRKEERYPCNDGKFTCYCVSNTHFESNAPDVRHMLEPNR